MEICMVKGHLMEQMGLAIQGTESMGIEKALEFRLMKKVGIEVRQKV